MFVQSGCGGGGRFSCHPRADAPSLTLAEVEKNANVERPSLPAHSAPPEGLLEELRGGLPPRAPQLVKLRAQPRAFRTVLRRREEERRGEPLTMVAPELLGAIESLLVMPALRRPRIACESRVALPPAAVLALSRLRRRQMTSEPKELCRWRPSGAIAERRVERVQVALGREHRRDLLPRRPLDELHSGDRRLVRGCLA